MLKYEHMKRAQECVDLCINVNPNFGLAYVIKG